MKQSKLDRIAFAKEVLDQNDIIYREFTNGQLQVDTVNFWATSEKWHDTKRNIKGQGINSFLKHLKNHEII